MKFITIKIILLICLISIFITMFCSCTGKVKEIYEQSKTSASVLSQTPVSNISSKNLAQSIISSSLSKYSSCSSISKIISSKNINNNSFVINSTLSYNESLSIFPSYNKAKIGMKGLIHVWKNPPNMPVTWNSSNPEIVKIVNWKGDIFVALAPGVSTITAESDDGLKDTCQITVEPDTKDNYVAITDLTFCSDDDLTIVARQNLQYDYFIKPNNATGQDKTTVVSSDPSVVKVDMIFFGHINIRGVSCGECDITFTTVNGIQKKLHVTVK